MVKGWGSEEFLRYWGFDEVKGVGNDPGEPKICVIESVLSEKTRILMV